MSTNTKFPLIIGVYGTLRHGASANALMDGATFLGRDSVKAKLFSLGAYPGLTLDESFKTVVDLYEVRSQQHLDNLNRYEGYYPDAPEKSLYIPVTTRANLLEADIMVYQYNIDDSEKNTDFLAVIENGDWLDYVKN